ncbi:MAG: uracil-DNA glycosylase [Synergistaceae bacterium]
MPIDNIFNLDTDAIKQIKDTIWLNLRDEINKCSKCGLSTTRINVVFGEGSLKSKIMFIGEAPGADEDELAKPFVGKAGQLLTQILSSVSINRDEIFITNIVKCRPPENRVPTLEEIASCSEYLETQILLLNPSIIVLLGNTPTKSILKTNEGITKLRGKWYSWNGIAIMPIFHPSYLLRNSSAKEGSPKHLTWLDIQEINKQWQSIKKFGEKTSDIKYG